MIQLYHLQNLKNCRTLRDSEVKGRCQNDLDCRSDEQIES